MDIKQWLLHGEWTQQTRPGVGIRGLCRLANRYVLWKEGGEFGLDNTFMCEAGASQFLRQARQGSCCLEIIGKCQNVIWLTKKFTYYHPDLITG